MILATSFLATRLQSLPTKPNMHFSKTIATSVALLSIAAADNVENCNNSCNYGGNSLGACPDVSSCVGNCIACTNQGMGVSFGQSHD